VSAPGKLMLLGDHTVVYGQPCLVTSVSSRIKVNIQSMSDEVLNITIPDLEQPIKKSINDLLNNRVSENTRFVESAIRIFYQKYSVTSGLKITTQTEPYFKYGLGSSAAVTVATIFGLNILYGKNLGLKEIFNLACSAVLHVQGLGSGFDVAAATYGGVLYYVKPGKIIEKLNLTYLPIVVAYSGQKADTVSLVKNVAEKFKQYPDKVKRICEACGKLVEHAKKSLMGKDWERMGLYMDMNQEYLRDMGVSTEKLETLILAAKKAGAWGAKLSGAGGGDCTIAIAPKDKVEDVKQAINLAGGKVIDVTTNVEGVRIEKII